MHGHKPQPCARDFHRDDHYNDHLRVHYDDHLRVHYDEHRARDVHHDDPSRSTCGVLSVPSMELRGEVRHELLRGEDDVVDGDFHGGKRDGDMQGYSVQHDDLQLNDDEDSDDLARDGEGRYDVHGVRAHDHDHESKLRGSVAAGHVPQEFPNVREYDGQVHLLLHGPNLYLQFPVR